MADKLYCKKCKTTMDPINFYATYRTDKYPTGKLDQCKKCITMHVDNWDPKTYLWILEEVDVPYIKSEWEKVMMKFQENPEKLTSMTIMGRYLGRMKLLQFKDYRWADSERIEEELKQAHTEALRRQGLTEEEIEETLAEDREMKTHEAVVEELHQRYQEIKKKELGLDEPEEEEDPFGPSYFVDDLTDDDRKYLSLKWGRLYSPEDWVRLEKLYVEMSNSFEIQNAGHEDNLKLLCKCSLKTHQLIDACDLEGAAKASRMYDSLLKSGKFSAVQNKADSDELFDSVGELVAMCEEDGYIPKYYIEQPEDKVDETLRDLENYTSTLVREEANLGNLIESAIKEMQKQEAREYETEDDALTDDDFFEFERVMEGEEEEEEENTEEGDES